jgi:dTDP-4-dehydrorhamnose 3,5-epimerase
MIAASLGTTPTSEIAWPAAAGSAALSDKDRKWPRLRDLVEVWVQWAR